MSAEWKNEKCINCIFADFDTPSSRLGKCRRNPVTIAPSPSPYSTNGYGYPDVESNCKACAFWEK
jgi:hypothetical protein